MAYDVTKLTTVGQLKALAQRAKGAIEAAIAALPVEMFLDQAHTEFVGSFAYSAQTYPGATNPNLEGKPVLVLAVKGVDNADPTNASKQTLSYSFLDVSSLVDTYTTAAGDSTKVLTISGYTVSFNVSATAGNILSVNNDGLYATNRLASFTQGNIVTSDANGAPQDGGIAASTLLVDGDVATDAEVTEVLTEVFGAAS